VLRLVGSTDRGRISIHKNHRGDIASGLDTDINLLIRRSIPRADEGWLSEESRDDLTRLDRRRVWVVDPIDGTRESLSGIAEWCVSIGLIEDTEAVAGAVLNPLTGEMYIGSVETGLESIRSGNVEAGPDLSLVVSRREYGEGKWRSVENVHGVLENRSPRFHRISTRACRTGLRCGYLHLRVAQRMGPCRGE
jgi:myo-inositol-1(or 4)-monophosphatase